jgi:N,N-dimethylformamidase
LIGDFLSLGLGRGAAGDEIDRADDKLGTPPQAVFPGSATGFSVVYQQAIEERCQIESVSLQQDDANIRADLVWFDTSAGGAVFSAGSINWISCLTHNDCNNNVSTLTNNVLSRMLKTST